MFGAWYWKCRGAHSRSKQVFATLGFPVFSGFSPLTPRHVTSFDWRGLNSRTHGSITSVLQVSIEHNKNSRREFVYITQHPDN